MYSRAALSAVNSESKELHRICSRSCSIGTSGHCDIVLSNAKNCKRVSTLHARVFYDEVGERYELLNYSCYGTVVNGFLYGIDGSAQSLQLNNKYHKPCKSHRSHASQGWKLSKAIQSVIYKSEPDVRHVKDEAKVKTSSHTCKCHTKKGRRCGWEGAAILYHGSVISFGCNEFVFSLPEFSSKHRLLKQKTESITISLRQRMADFKKRKVLLKSRPKTKTTLLSPVRSGLSSHNKVIKMTKHQLEMTSKGPRKFKSVGYQVVDKRIFGKKDSNKSEYTKKSPTKYPTVSKQHAKPHHLENFRRKVELTAKTKPKKRPISKKAQINNAKEVMSKKMDSHVEDPANDSDTSLSEAGKGRRFSARQKARRARAHNRNSESDDGSIRDRSSSPSAFKSVMEAAIERKLNANDIDCKQNSATSTRGSSPVSVDEVEFSAESEIEPDEIALDQEDTPSAPKISVNDNSMSQIAVARQRSRSLMELMCTETLDDFESPSKDKLKNLERPLPVLIQNITRVHHDNSSAMPAAAYADEHGNDGSDNNNNVVVHQDQFDPQPSSLLHLADVVMKQA